MNQLTKKLIGAFVLVYIAQMLFSVFVADDMKNSIEAKVKDRNTQIEQLISQ